MASLNKKVASRINEAKELEELEKKKREIKKKIKQIKKGVK